MKTAKSKHSFSVDKNALVDDGEGKIVFTDGLTITDTTEQRNGTSYDIESMDISEYAGQLTANHSDRIEDIIGKVEGVRKVANKVVVGAIKFAVKENALAQYAYDLIKGGFLTDFSIETFGPYPDSEGVYYNSKLIGLSAVVVGNNRSAAINSIAKNSIKESKKHGLDTSIVENTLLCYDENKQPQTIKEDQTMSDMVKNEAAPKEAAETVKAKESAPTFTKEDIVSAINSAITPLKEEIAAVKEEAFNSAAKEPSFEKAQKATNSIVSSLSSMGYKERHGKQINYAWSLLKNHSQEAGSKLKSINQYHLEKLQEAGVVSNSITIEDMGNFVISPELLSEIEGHRSDYTPFLNLLDYRETLSLQMAWLTRAGDIDMQEVELCDDGADGNLKPISEYGATINTSNLHELAAVTPVCNAATRFLAADLLGDVAAGYRNDYDRKKAQLAIVRLQQAINATGNTYAYDKTTDVDSLKSWVTTMTAVAEEVMNGVFVFNMRSYGELLRGMIGAGVNGPMAGVFTTGDQPMILGRPYVVVPNDLMPDLNSGVTRTFTVEGSPVTITNGMFYFDPSTFSGRVSGGLQYDLSTEAAYEDGGQVKSAYQRNELVLRGSFFRGGAIRDNDKVSGMAAAAIS